MSSCCGFILLQDFFSLRIIVLQDIPMLLRPHKAALLQCIPRSLILLANCYVRCACAQQDVQIQILIKKRASQSILQPNCSGIKCNSILVLEKAVHWLLEVPMPRQFLSQISQQLERCEGYPRVQFAIVESCYCCNLWYFWRNTFDLISAWRVGSGTRYLQQYFTIPMAESSEMR